MSRSVFIYIRLSLSHVLGRFTAAVALLLPLLMLAAALPANAAAPADTSGAVDAVDANVNIIASHSGLCLEAQGSSVEPGAPIVQANCTGQPGAVWQVRVSSAGSGSVNLYNPNSGMCAELVATGGAGTLRQAPCDGQSKVSFLLEDRTTHVWIQPLSSNPARCLEVTGGSHTSGTAVHLAECHGQSGTAFHQRPNTAGNDPERDCLIGNINNDRVWTAHRIDELGKAEWHEYSDKLKVFDLKSDGYRTAGRIRVCTAGTWGAWETYDSGPNEGSTDSTTIDLELDEGRRVQIQACRKTGSGVDNCGPVVEGNA